MRLCLKCVRMLLWVMIRLLSQDACLAFALGAWWWSCMYERERDSAVSVCALLKLFCAWLLHVHRDLCHPLKQAGPLCPFCCLLTIWKQTIQRFQAAHNSCEASVNTLHIWEGSRKASWLQPTLMQLGSAAVMNGYSEQQTVSGKCTVVQTENNMWIGYSDHVLNNTSMNAMHCLFS